MSGQTWEEAQRRAFTYWVNTQLKRRDDSIENVLVDFASGVKLVNLVEILTSKDLSKAWARNPKMKLHKINNCFMALEHLKENEVTHITAAAEDFYNGNQNMILGFCWLLLRHFQGAMIGSGDGKGSKTTFEQGLLEWVRGVLAEYDDINLDAGFKSEDFKNGKALLGLVNEYDETFLDYTSYDKSDYHRNCKDAFEIAEDKMKIPAIIDYQDLATGQVGEKQLVLYLSLMYNAYKEQNLGMTKNSLSKKLHDLELKLSSLEDENSQLKAWLDSMNNQSRDLNAKLAMHNSETATLKNDRGKLKGEYDELLEVYEEDKAAWESELAGLKAKLADLSENSDAATTALQDEWHQINNSRDLLREEFQLAKEKLTREREELEAQQKKLLSKLEREKKMTEALQKIMDTQEAHHAKAIAALSKHFLQHVRDVNTWEPLLEEDREWQGNPVAVPEDSKFLKNSYPVQVEGLIDLAQAEAKAMGILLKAREVEAAEIVAVNIGKKKKRTKKPRL